MEKILVINLGGTSSKVALYLAEKLLAEKTIRHSEQEMADLKTNQEQVSYRVSMIKAWLDEIRFNLNELTAVAVRGGNIPLRYSHQGGTYLIDDDLREKIYAEYDQTAEFYHGVIISIPVATELTKLKQVPIFVTDPPTVNELQSVAKIAGHPKFERTAVFHALNQRAVAHRVAKELNKDYQEARLIVVHLGAGISVGVHQDGKIIDVNNCTGGDGPMAPNRAGQLPMGQLLKIAVSGEYTMEEIQLMMRGGGGVRSYLGTDDMREVEGMIDAGNTQAKLIWEALVYQVAKEIGSSVAVLSGKVDGIVYTGGIAHSEKIIKGLNERVSTFAPTFVLAGEFENEGLALGALRVIRKEELPVKI